MRKEYDEMCPVHEKDIVIRDNTEISITKKENKKKEKRWRKLRIDAAAREYMDMRNRLNKAILKRKCEYYRQKTLESRWNISNL